MTPFFILTAGVAWRGDSSEAFPLYPPEADGGWTKQPARDAGGRGGEQEKCGEAGLHTSGAGLSMWHVE